MNSIISSIQDKLIDRAYFMSLLVRYQSILQILILLLLNYFTTKYLYRALPEEQVYENSSIFFSLHKEFSWKLLFFMLAPLFLWNIKWNDLVEKKEEYIKYFVLFIMSIWAWKVISLDFNLYFNQTYHLDRALLAILAILAFRFPIALIYFLLLSLLFFNQVSFPAMAGAFPSQYIDSTPLIDILILFTVYAFLKKLYTKVSILSFFIVVLCLHASNYFIPGLAKIFISENYIDWMYINDLSNILSAQYFQGWLVGVFSWERIQELLKIVHLTTVPLQVGAFITQIIVIFIFINRKFTLALFATFELLHIGVFIVSGIFFWKWILLNLSMLYVINKLNEEQIQKIFNIKMMIITIYCH